LDRARRGIPRTAWPLCLLAVIALAASACSAASEPGGVPGFFPPSSASAEGREIVALYEFTFWIAAAVFLLVEGLILWNVFRYRRRKGDDTLPHQTHGNLFAEILWTAVPAVIVLVLFVVSLQTLSKVEARSPEPGVVVDVYGFQWQWAFGYDCPADFEQTFTKIDDCGLALTGLGNKGPEMVLPVNEPVRIRLHGTDVNHAFYVPRFLYKKDVIPGQVNSFEVNIEEPGTYTGQCAEFCGLAHASMNFTVRAVDRSEFETWKQRAEEEAAASPTPGPSGPPGSPGQEGAVVELSASNAQAFDQTSAEAPADRPFAIQFRNDDPAAPHNVAIRQATPEGDFVGMPIADPGTEATYQPPPLAAGEYTFYCSVHPNMQGTLTVR
jgi:cytochrome c oxidase subunit II